MVRKIVLVESTLAAQYGVHFWYKFCGGGEINNTIRRVILDAVGGHLGTIGRTTNMLSQD